MPWKKLIKSFQKTPYSSNLEKNLKELVDYAWVYRLNLKIRDCKKVVEVGNVPVALNNQKIIIKFFEILTGNEKKEATKDELLAKLYNLEEKSLATCSPRRLQSTSNRLIKIISRARRILEQNLSGNKKFQRISWLPFDDKTQSWSLARVHKQKEFVEVPWKTV